MIPYPIAQMGYFDPRKIANLSLWLDASDPASITASGGSVSQWNDKSGLGNNVTQGTAASQPTTGSRTINGLNAIDFDGSNDYLLIPSSFYSGSIDIANGDSTTLFVYQTDAASTQQRLISGTTNSGGNSRWSIEHAATGANNLQSRSGNGGTLNYSITLDTGQHIAGWQEAGTNFRIYYDSNVSSDGSGGDVALTSAANQTIGAYVNNVPSITIPFNGMFAEILSYKRALSVAEITSIRSYLKAKWGTP